MKIVTFFDNHFFDMLAAFGGLIVFGLLISR